MLHFNTIEEVIRFFYKNYNIFLRYEDGTTDYNGTTYKIEMVGPDGSPVLKLSYFTDEGNERVIFGIFEFGMVITTGRTDDGTPEIIDYVDILKEGLFGLTIYDLAKMNFLHKQFKNS